MKIVNKINQIIKTLQIAHPKTTQDRIVNAVELLLEGRSIAYTSVNAAISHNTVAHARSLLNDEGLIEEYGTTAPYKWKRVLKNYNTLSKNNKIIAKTIANNINKDGVDKYSIYGILTTTDLDDMINYVIDTHIISPTEYKEILTMSLQLGWERDKPYKGPEYGFLDSKGYHAMKQCYETRACI